VHVSDPIFLYSLPQPDCALHLKVQIFVGKGARVDFVWESNEAVLNNAYIDCILEDEARVTCTISDGYAKWHVNTIRAYLKKNSAITVLSDQRTADFSRQDIQVTLAEEGSEALLKGCWFARGDSQCHSLISALHLAPHTRSQQHYKGVLTDKSKSSFEGRIFVSEKAQYTEAYQLNNNLIVGEKAAAYSKPNLKIFTDDVKASHGCTISDVSEEELLYLKTRGLDDALCRDLLIKGFLKEILDAFLLR
jgi:Fe-S cluster assembly protein SufD